MVRRIFQLGQEAARQHEKRIRDSEIPALTGKKRDDGTITLRGSDAYGDRLPTGKIYVRLRGLDSDVREAWAVNIGRRANVDVIVKFDSANRLTVIRLDDEPVTETLGEQASDFASPAKTGAQLDLVPSLSLMPGRLYLQTAGTLDFNVMTFPYYDSDGNRKTWEPTETNGVTLTPPAAVSGLDQHRYTVITLDPDASAPALVAVNGSSSAYYEPIDRADIDAIALTTGFYPMWAVEVKTGDTTSTVDKWVDLRHFIDRPPVSLSLLGGAPNTATYITQTPSADLQNEQALSLLATGYVKNTTGTGVITTQAAPIPVADGGTGSTSAAAARTALGLGTMAQQNASAIAVTGGAIDGTPIGGTTRAAVSATALSVAQGVTESEFYRDGAAVAVNLTTYGSANGAVFRGRTSSGSLLTPTAANGILFSLAAQGHDGTGFVTGARFFFNTTTTFSGTNRGTEISFQTVPETTTGLREVMRFQHRGVVQIYDAYAAPSSSTADSIQVWSESVAGLSEFKARDESGNVTTLSSHSPQMIDVAGRPTDFVHKEHNLFTGVDIEMDVYGALAALETLTGQQFIYMRDLKEDQIEDWDRNQTQIKREREAQLARWDAAESEYATALAEYKQLPLSKRRKLPAPERPPELEMPRPVPYTEKTIPARIAVRVQERKKKHGSSK